MSINVQVLSKQAMILIFFVWLKFMNINKAMCTH